MTAIDDVAPSRPHPAAFSKIVLARAREFLPPAPARVLDPFAGIGRVHELVADGYDTVGVELEPEWATQHERTLVGDATALPFDDGAFDVVFTSPAYGNRFADAYDGRDGSERRTYRLDLGRELTPGSSAGMHWGPDYRDLHRRAWLEVRRVLCGRLVLNISDHIRGGQRQRVSAWHVRTLLELGFDLAGSATVLTHRHRKGANHELRIDGEMLVAFDRGDDTRGVLL